MHFAASVSKRIIINQVHLAGLFIGTKDLE
jgi:hypothetical protein